MRRYHYSTLFTFVSKTPAPNIWKIAKYGDLTLGSKILQAYVMSNVEFLLGKNTARAQHEPFIKVMIHLRGFPLL